MQHRELAHWLIQELGRVNPYRRDRDNLRSEFYVYNLGFLAGVLADAMREDPALALRVRRLLAARSHQR